MRNKITKILSVVVLLFAANTGTFGASTDISNNEMLAKIQAQLDRIEAILSKGGIISGPGFIPGATGAPSLMGPVGQAPAPAKPRIDFGGGFGPGGMSLPMPALVASQKTMMLQDGTSYFPHPMFDSFLERNVSEWEQDAFHYGPFTPDVARQMLMVWVKQRCVDGPVEFNVDWRPTCVGIDTRALVDRLIDHYTRWNNAKLANYYDILASYGNQAPEVGTPPPPPGYVPYR